MSWREREEREDRGERGEREERRDREERERRRAEERRRRRRSPSPPSPPPPPTISGPRDEEEDWYCSCGSYNFKRRQYCYRRNCGGRRAEPPDLGITKRILLRRLDALTTEERILEELKDRCSRELVDAVAGISVGREPLTGASKCLAYINFENVTQSAAALAELQGLSPALRLDGREPLISYYNEPPKYQKNAPDNRMTDYASYYAQAYGATSKTGSEQDRVNAAAAVAASALARASTWTPAAPAFSRAGSGPDGHTPPAGDGAQRYAAPDVRTFQYDETSGYYYDPSTGLYYDGATQYFYNNRLHIYMYWDAANFTYIKATQAQQNTDQPKLPELPLATVENTIAKEPEEKKKPKEKEDKVKVAKKIAKDMERWARTLNQKKENARNNYVTEQPSERAPSKGSADIGFSVLGEAAAPPPGREPSPPPPEEPGPEPEEGIIDWAKLSCLLCKRKFPSAEVLAKHESMSELHRQNLSELRGPAAGGYRDRAAERRLKFGESSPPPPPARAAPAAPPAPLADSLGGRMLRQMGWREGRGLGRQGQGRTAPVEAAAGLGGAGLGQKRGIYTPTPGETYRDTVKKLMIARYKEVVGQEDDK